MNKERIGRCDIIVYNGTLVSLFQSNRQARVLNVNSDYMLIQDWLTGTQLFTHIDNVAKYNPESIEFTFYYLNINCNVPKFSNFPILSFHRSVYFHNMLMNDELCTGY